MIPRVCRLINQIPNVRMRGLTPPIAGKLYVTHNLGGKVLVRGWGFGNAGVASHPGRYVQIFET